MFLVNCTKNKPGLGGLIQVRILQAQPVPPTMMQRIREARGPPATRKTGIILALAIIAVAVIVVTAVMLSVGRDSDAAGGRGLEGEGLLDNKPTAAPITAQEMARILEGIDESLKQSQELVVKYQGMSRHEILKASENVSVKTLCYHSYFTVTLCLFCKRNFPKSP